MFIINESASRGTRSRVFGMSHASGLGGYTRSTKCIARLDLAVSIQRAAEGEAGGG